MYAHRLSRKLFKVNTQLGASDMAEHLPVHDSARECTIHTMKHMYSYTHCTSQLFLDKCEIRAFPSSTQQILSYFPQKLGIIYMNSYVKECEEL